MPEKRCPYCGSDAVMLFFPNIPAFTTWHCSSCDQMFPATEAEADAEIERRAEQRAEESDDDDDFAFSLHDPD
jgi:ribosomal protein L37AE/L43A